MEEQKQFTFDELLNQIDKKLEQKTKVVKVPIALKEFKVKPIITSDESYLKSLNANNVFKIVLKVYELILSKCQPVNQTTNLLFEQLSQEISHHDIFTLAKTLLEISYDTFKTYDINVSIECPVCKTIHTNEDINNAKIKYSDFILESKEWDKDIPFNEYTIKYTEPDIIVEQDTYDIYIIPVITLQIPTLKKVIDSEKYITEYQRKKELEVTMFSPRSITNINERTLNDLSVNKRDIVFAITKDITFYSVSKDKITDTELLNKRENILDIINNEDNIATKYTVNEPTKILSVLDKFPLSIHENIIEYYNQEFRDYIPVYTCKDKFKCKECGVDIEITLNPIFNLLDRLLLS